MLSTSCTIFCDFRRSFFFEGFKASIICLSCKSNNYVRMSVEQWCSDTDGEEQSAWRRNQWQLHFIYHKCRSATKPEPERSEAAELYWAMHVHLRQVSTNCIWRSSPFLQVNTKLWIPDTWYCILIFPTMLRFGKYTWLALCLLFKFCLFIFRLFMKAA